MITIQEIIKKIEALKAHSRSVKVKKTKQLLKEMSFDDIGILISAIGEIGYELNQSIKK